MPGDHLPLVDPFNEEQLQPCSYDLLLDADVKLDPLCFERLSTIETIKIPYSLQGQIHGRSSLARLGVFIHISAGFVDSGFDGTLTLECFNASNYTWRGLRGMKVAQIAFYRLDFPTKKPYQGRYQNQVGATPNRDETLNG